MALAIDCEPCPGDRDLHAGPGPVHELLDVRGQPTEVYRPLHQPPQAEPAQDGERRQEGPERCQDAVGAAPYSAGG